MNYMAEYGPAGNANGLTTAAGAAGGYTQTAVMDAFRDANPGVEFSRHYWSNHLIPSLKALWKTARERWELRQRALAAVPAVPAPPSRRRDGESVSAVGATPAGDGAGASGATAAAPAGDALASPASGAGGTPEAEQLWDSEIQSSRNSATAEGSADTWSASRGAGGAGGADAGGAGGWGGGGSIVRRFDELGAQPRGGRRRSRR